MDLHCKSVNNNVLVNATLCGDDKIMEISIAFSYIDAARHLHSPSSANDIWGRHNSVANAVSIEMSKERICMGVFKLKLALRFYRADQTRLINFTSVLRQGDEFKTSSSRNKETVDELRQFILQCENCRESRNSTSNHS